MVWKKKKHIRQLQKKRSVNLFGVLKKILNKNFSDWKERFFLNLEDCKKFLKKFEKKNSEITPFIEFITSPLKNFIISKKQSFFNILNNVILKKWIISLLKVLIKKGKKKKAFTIIKYILLNIKNKSMKFKNFFFKIKKNMHLPLRLRIRIVAGRKTFIPVILLEKNQIMFILRFIFSSLKFRNEKSFKLKLLNELFDVFNNKGFSIKKKIQYNKDIKENIPNIRYLNFK